jgi:PPK2 family polyphosphate:nucleotide phosphotransferase
MIEYIVTRREFEVKIDPNDFIATENEKIDLLSRKTLISPYYTSKKHYKKMLAKEIGEMSKLQKIHYAHNKYSLLIIFQAMDAAGKDSTIRKVMSGINPQGCSVNSFKQPNTEELDHDFLWRTNKRLPERGMIGIFNRSYYEEVLIVKVHPEILSKQTLPVHITEDDDIWEKRYRSINDMEKHIYSNGTRIIKFFLHISKEEQKRRFLRRIDQDHKNWKFSKNDVHERKYWDDYMKAYEDCLSKTSKNHAPWYIVPADDKKNMHLIVSQIIVDTFNKLDISYPEMSAEHKEELIDIGNILRSEK